MKNILTILFFIHLYHFDQLFSNINVTPQCIDANETLGESNNLVDITFSSNAIEGVAVINSTIGSFQFIAFGICPNQLFEIKLNPNGFILEDIILTGRAFDHNGSISDITNIDSNFVAFNCSTQTHYRRGTIDVSNGISITISIEDDVAAIFFLIHFRSQGETVSTPVNDVNNNTVNLGIYNNRFLIEQPEKLQSFNITSNIRDCNDSITFLASFYFTIGLLLFSLIVNI